MVPIVQPLVLRLISCQQTDWCVLGSRDSWYCTKRTISVAPTPPLTLPIVPIGCFMVRNATQQPVSVSVVVGAGIENARDKYGSRTFFVVPIVPTTRVEVDIVPTNRLVCFRFM